MKTEGKIWLFYDAEKKEQSKPMSVVQAQVFLLSLKKNDHLKYFVWTPGWPDWTCVKDFLKSGQNYFVMTKPPKPVGVTEDLPSKDESTLVIEAEAGSADKTNTGTLVTMSGLFTKVRDDKPLKKSEPIDYGYYHHDFNGDDLDLSKINQVSKPEKVKVYEETVSRNEDSDRRKDTRHNFKIEIILVSKTKSFRTFSRDISISGTQLEKEIPRDFLNVPFDLIVVNPYDKDSSRGRLLFRAKIVGDMTDPRRLMFIEQDHEMTVKLDALLRSYTKAQAADRKSAG
ncbi:PilZ domain-containing protein [Bdellovibrio sp. SKB1291214]|uniref:PilZ domain-containing protein n=1 Tax=Bdellovibrio sp. SKB1291214 TaxID=1732569 RepID=UPI000B51AE53|nr:PilZ domain-containing protein [Bdellovibrio sp. SKB1291214]UYL10227.1 PilZ domain-containing protein [Bdellovibrio sp. SKB1291214]